MKRPPELYFLFFLHLLQWLDHTPFDTYLLPGILLLVFMGVLPLFTLTGLIYRRNRHWANGLNIYMDKYWAWTYSLFCGIILILDHGAIVYYPLFLAATSTDQHWPAYYHFHFDAKSTEILFPVSERLCML